MLRYQSLPISIIFPVIFIYYIYIYEYIFNSCDCQHLTKPVNLFYSNENIFLLVDLIFYMTLWQFDRMIYTSYTFHAKQSIVLYLASFICSLLHNKLPHSNAISLAIYDSLCICFFTQATLCLCYGNFILNLYPLIINKD